MRLSNSHRLAITFVFSLILTGLVWQHQSVIAARSTPSLTTLPPELRPRGEAILKENDPKKRAKLAGDLAKSHPAPAMDFLLDVLDIDTSDQVRGEIVNRLGMYRHDKVQAALLKRIHTAKEAEKVVEIAFNRLRENQQYAMPKGLSLGTLTTSNQSIRVVIFGDFGSGSKEQKEIATSIQAYHKATPFNLGLTVGDNFYKVGCFGENLNSPAHEHWKTRWEDLYTNLGIKFYAAFGNHDWEGTRKPLAEILYSGRSESWRLPATYYTFNAGPVQFFALDTGAKGEMSKEQLDWLEQELGKSSATWKVVYGHHPIKSDGKHGNTTFLEDNLLHRLKGKAHVYIAGHDHDLQHLKPQENLHLFISGGGGREARKLGEKKERIWGKSAYGFNVLEADQAELKIKFIGLDGASPLCAVTLNKLGQTSLPCPE